MKKYLLFINGQPPNVLPNCELYDGVGCSDGAFHYLKEKNFPLEKLDFISGDFDSHSGIDDAIYQEKFIHTPDQNKTDFEKSLEIILENGGSEVVVYGGSGGEMDHYLGNLHVALKMKSKLKIYFVDEFSNYFFAEKTTMLNDVEGKMISLYPFPKAQKVKSLGLQWELDAEDLDLSSRIGIRNRALQHVVCIEYQSGELLIFQSHN
ncbi:thiamine diphosphokinase [Amniculibacterium sp. G2-70]|uniref:thiamine diphosphokinase n=1 Tax=Amniculibacterium sp. G2-70 TaxID=2767188 RepID=UPI0016540360|nr:thiamine diphosphokinase [Amniculibacterium sp. G2-70]